MVENMKQWLGALPKDWIDSVLDNKSKEAQTGEPKENRINPEDFKLDETAIEDNHLRLEEFKQEYI